MIIKPSGLLERMLKIQSEGKPREGVSTGFASLDELFLLNKRRLFVLTGIPGQGKALSLLTPIPTPNGWSSMGELSIGDELFDENGEICTVLNATEAMFKRKCYELTFTGGEKIIADADHLWLTQNNKERCSARNAKIKNRVKPRDLLPRGSDQSHKRSYPSIRTTQQIADSMFCEHGKRLNHSVKFAGPIDLPQKDFLIPPYVLGAWLGDGTSANGSITTGDPDMIDMVASYGYVTTKHSTDYGYGVLGLSKQLRALGLIKNKHVPSEYLRGSIQQRLELLRGFMDSDGCCSPSGTCEFSSTRLNLAEAVQELILSLGMMASMQTGVAKLYGKECGPKYRVMFTSKVDVFTVYRKLCRQVKEAPRLNRRMIVSCEEVESVPVRCIKVSSISGLFLAGKHFIPTHNSEWLDAITLNTALLHGWKWQCFSPEADPQEGDQMQGIVSRLTGKQIVKSTRIEIENACRWAEDHFSWLNLPYEKRTLDDMLQLTEERILMGEQIDGVIIDPWNEMNHSEQRTVRDDIYIGAGLSKVNEFKRKYDVLFIIVVHPHSVAKNKDGNYPVIHIRECNGGITWYAKADYGVCVNRRHPVEHGLDIYVQKVKKKSIGHAGTTFLNYEPLGGRFKDEFAPDFTLPQPHYSSEQLPFLPRDS